MITCEYCDGDVGLGVPCGCVKATNERNLWNESNTEQDKDVVTEGSPTCPYCKVLLNDWRSWMPWEVVEEVNRYTYKEVKCSNRKCKKTILVKCKHKLEWFTAKGERYEV